MAANIFSVSLRRAFGKRYWLAAALFIAALTFDSGFNLVKELFGTFNEDSCVYYYYFYPMSFGGVYCRYFAAMLAVLPFAFSYADEREIQPYIISRAGMTPYCLSKTLCSALAGGVVLAGGSFLFIAGLSLKIPLVTEYRLFEAQWIPFYNLLREGNGVGYFIVCVYLAFLTGFLWGSAAICVSAYIPNKFVTLISPFVLSFLLTQICRLLHLDNNVRLDMMLSGNAWLGSNTVTLLTVTAIVLLIWFVCFVQFTNKVKRAA